MRSILLTTLLIGMNLVFTGSLLASDNNPDLVAAQRLIESEEYNKAEELLKNFKTKNSNKKIEKLRLLSKIYLFRGGITNRQKSERYLKEALQSDPENPQLLMDMAYLKEAQTYFSHSERYFREVLKVDPLNIEAHSKLIDYYLENDKPQKLSELEKGLVEYQSQNPEDKQAQMLLGMIYLGEKKIEKAEEILEPLMADNPEDPRLYYYLAMTYFENGENAKFTNYYLKSLEKIKDPDQLGKEVVNMELLISGDEKKELNKLHPEEQGNFLSLFWRRNDPNPMTPENERLVEHVRRIEYARKNFPSGRKTGFDDRGRVYIKFGEPDDKYIDDGGFGSVKQNESWAYYTVHPRLHFDFVDIGGFYREVRDLREAMTSTSGGDRAIQSMYQERAHLGGIYGIIGFNTGNADIATMLEDNIIDKYDAEASAPQFQLDVKFKPLQCALNFARFRGEDGKARLETYFGTYLNQFEAKSIVNDQVRFTFVNTLAVFDSTFERIIHRPLFDDRLYPSEEAYKKAVTLSQDVEYLDPWSYHIAFEMRELTNNKGNIYKKDMIIPDYYTNDLTASDIQFSPRIAPAAPEDKYVKKGLNVVPYPYHIINKNRLIFIYMEIYNLMVGPDDRTRYKVSYKISQKDPKGSFIESTAQALGSIFMGDDQKSIETAYEQEGQDKNPVEYMAFDFSALPAGESRITITIEDLIVKRSVQVSSEFRLVE